MVNTCKISTNRHKHYRQTDNRGVIPTTISCPSALRKCNSPNLRGSKPPETPPPLDSPMHFSHQPAYYVHSKKTQNFNQQQIIDY